MSPFLATYRRVQKGLPSMPTEDRCPACQRKVQRKSQRILSTRAQADDQEESRKAAEQMTHIWNGNWVCSRVFEDRSWLFWLSQLKASNRRDLVLLLRHQPEIQQGVAALQILGEGQDRYYDEPRVRHIRHPLDFSPAGQPDDMEDGRPRC